MENSYNFFATADGTSLLVLALYHECPAHGPAILYVKKTTTIGVTDPDGSWIWAG